MAPIAEAPLTPRRLSPRVRGGEGRRILGVRFPEVETLGNERSPSGRRTCGLFAWLVVAGALIQSLHDKSQPRERREVRRNRQEHDAGRHDHESRLATLPAEEPVERRG